MSPIRLPQQGCWRLWDDTENLTGRLCPQDVFLDKDNGGFGFNGFNDVGQLGSGQCLKDVFVNKDVGSFGFDGFDDVG